MSRRTKILLGIILAVAIGVGALCVWQWNNISAAISFLRFSQQELEEKLEQNDQAIKDAVNALPDVSIRDITQEEKDALREGTLTQEELIDNLLKPEPKPDTPDTKQETGENEPEKPDVVSKPEQNVPDTPEQKPEQPPETQPEPPVQSEYEKQLAAIIAEVYVLREEFLIKLEDLLEEAKALYKSLPAEERTKSKMVPLVADYMARGVNMEEQCDAKIAEILNRLETLVRENNGDPNLAQTIFDTYVNEKSIKKAWYMAELKEKGLV